MARTGPNQDINDPTTILEVNKFYYDKSVDFGDLKAISDSQDPDATGPPVTTVDIPLKLANGSTSLLDGSIVTDEFTADDPNLSVSVINTYIDLAERFRNYWELLRQSIVSLADFATTTTTAIPAIPSSPVSGQAGFTSGALSSIQYDYSAGVFEVDYPDTPTWSGHRPTDYNQNTYPQLLNELNNLEASVNTSSSVEVDEVYQWTNWFIESQGIPFAITRQINVSDTLSNLFTVDAVEIPNFSSTENLIVDLTADASYNRTVASGALIIVTEQVTSQSFVAMSGHNFSIGSLDFVEENITNYNSPGVTSVLVTTLNASHTREIIVPPNTSAYIRVFATVWGDIESSIGGAMDGTSSVSISYPGLSKSRGPTLASISWPTIS